MRLDGWPCVCGTDEVGRGPLAGPVYAAAVVLPPDGAARLAGLDDSKRLTAAERERLAPQVRAIALAWAVVARSPADIDRLNILGAALDAMGEAVARVRTQLLARSGSVRVMVAVDGNQPLRRLPPGWEQRTIVGGDARSTAIAAASVLAKVERDAAMDALDAQYPGYGFARHKGYPTPDHLDALRRLGPCALHRRSFAPVRTLLAGRQGNLL
ncbi:MAG: ribonuclease HII [Myxococcales bacterium]|nr:ribonuclease HII [Myxococcales bacterium]